MLDVRFVLIRIWIIIDQSIIPVFV